MAITGWSTWQHEGPPTPQQLGVWHHVCLGTLDIQAVYKTVMDRGYTPPKEPGINARDGRWLLQLYDKNGTRTEIMAQTRPETLLLRERGSLHQMTTISPQVEKPGAP